MKNKLFILFILALSLHMPMAGQVGINILTPHPSAALQIESPAGTQRGMLTPSMTAVNRISLSTGTNVAADGLIVYDITHKMHYYYQGALNKWVSMSPLVLSTPTSSSAAAPSGVITTPQSTNIFSLGINTQAPAQALHVIGNALISGTSTSGGSIVTGNSIVSGTLTVSTLSVNTFPLNSLVPAGAIIMWSGTVIPTGWGLCDGTTYSGMVSPDLRGRFIAAVDNVPNTQSILTSQYLVYPNGNSSPPLAPNDGATLNYGAIGNKGGENGHIITLSESASHNHNVSASINNGSFFGFSGPGNTNIGSGTAAGGDAYVPTVSVSQTSQGGNQIHENRPPYYVLAFIIKLP